MNKKIFIYLFAALLLISSSYAINMTANLVAGYNFTATTGSVTGFYNGTASAGWTTQTTGCVSGNCINDTTASANIGTAMTNTQFVDNITLSCWYKFKSATGTQQTWGDYNGANNEEHGLYFDNAGYKMAWYVRNPAVANDGVEVAYTADTARWQMITFQWQKNYRQLVWIEGVLKGNETSSNMDMGTASNYMIGTAEGNEAAGFTGFIDECYAYRRMLTQDEILCLNGTASSGCSPTYPFTSAPIPPTYNSLGFPTAPHPANNTQYNTTNITFDILLNATYANNNVSLWLDGSKVNSQIKSSGNNQNVTFNTLVSQGQHTFYWNGTNNETSILSSTTSFLVDSTAPTFVYGIVNNIEYAKLDNITSIINITDAINVLQYNVSIDSTNILSTTGISSTAYKVNFSSVLNSLSYGNHNLTITAYDGLYSPLNSYSQTTEFSINRTLLNITAIQAPGTTPILIFDIIANSTNSSDAHLYSTTNGSVIVRGLINQTYNLLIDAPGYAFANTTQSFLLNTSSYVFSLYTTNSILFYFKDENTYGLINTTNVSVELISTLYSTNRTTTNGTLYIDLLTPETYTIRYSAPSYYQSFYYLTLGNRTNTTLNLYLGLNSSHSPVNVIIYDQSNNLVEGVVVKLKKYDLPSNSYLLKEMATTNFEGKAVIHPSINTEFYKFTFEYNGQIVGETTPSYIYTTGDLQYTITIGNQTLSNFFTSHGVDVSLTFNNATNAFRFTYNDPDNTIYGGCLYLYGESQAVRTLRNSSCVTGAASTILLGVSDDNITIYTAKGYIKPTSTIEELVSSLSVDFFNDKITNNITLFMVIILTIIFFFIGIYSRTMASILTPMPLFLTSMLGIVDVNRGITTAFLLLGILLAYIMKD